MSMNFFTTVQGYNDLPTIKFSPQLNYRSCIYELFQLIKKYISKATLKKLCAKVFHIICLLFRYTNVESNKIKFFIFIVFLWFTIIFKYLVEIKKRKQRHNS